VDYELTRRVLAALHEHAVSYKLFGAVALNLHGLARATEDRGEAEALMRRFKFGAE
jgi:hypothetical protein